MEDTPTKEQTEEIANSLAAGKKIEAIKTYREATGKGLKEAKDFIDALIPKLKESDPEKYANLSAKQGVGCASVIVLCIGVTATSIVWIIKSIL